MCTMYKKFCVCDLRTCVSVGQEVHTVLSEISAETLSTFAPVYLRRLL